MLFSQELYARALAFAASAHGEQKTPAGLPYVVHVASVAMEVMAALRAQPGHDENLAGGRALLHAGVAATPPAPPPAEREFGAPAAARVAASPKDAAPDNRP